jgi:hypothetical protein
MIVGKVRPAFLVLCLLAPPLADPAAALTSSQIKCATAIGKAGLGFVRKKLKLEQKCRDANLADPGSCMAPDGGALAKVDAALHTALVKRCTLASAGLKGIGFPGPCTDANVADGFTADDLDDCMRTSHDAIVAKMLALQYDATLAGPLSKERLACQREVAKQSAAFTACVLKSVQTCRALVMKGKLPGVPAHLCATDDAKTAARIAKCRSKLLDGIGSRCSDADVANLAVCTPDTSAVDDAGTCLVDAHTVLIDGPAIDVPADLIDYEYAVRGGLCGDGVVNNLAEECDGNDDAACPGACGAALEPDGYFACVCTDTPRLRVVEHRDADTDNGWTGNSADTGVAEGGGYLVDLYDCDGSGLCNVGPSCSLAPHSPCGVLLAAPSGLTGNQICASLGQGTCRKSRTATGPHCFQDIQKKCDPNQPSDPVCNGLGDFCTVTPVAPPNPVSSGGVSVCNVTIFSEDVVGTVNVLMGESVVRAPQRSRTYSRTIGAANKPCPVCGGFCGVSRERCETTDDCAPGKGPCVTAAVCSDGPNAGKSCRRTVPFGSPTTFFGTTSVDCQPEPTAEITSPHGLDLYVTNRSTGPVSLLPSVSCTNAGFTGNACLGGSSAGRPCSVASECPGGSCSPQCFCDGQARPNACNAACVGGPNDATECVGDSECPGGFCHAADCRLDPNDHDSAQEGICTTGPAEGWCSTTTYRPCTTDAQCSLTGCPYCVPGETCVSTKRACFLNDGIMRQGTPRTPEGVSVGIYCIDGDKDAVNSVAGFPGPAAFTQPELQIVVP